LRMKSEDGDAGSKELRPVRELESFRTLKVRQSNRQILRRGAGLDSSRLPSILRCAFGGNCGVDRSPPVETTSPPPIAMAADQRSPEQLLEAADGARDGRRYGEAAELYGAYLRERPEHAAIWVQCGHMLKESGCTD